MTASAIPATETSGSLPSDRSAALGRLKLWDAGFRFMTFGSASLVLILLLGVAITLFIGAWPAFRHFGLDFFIHRRVFRAVRCCIT
jgi:phosphate transport system permease protein